MSHTHIQLTGGITITHAWVPTLLASLAAIGESHDSLEAYLEAQFAQESYEDEWPDETGFQDDGWIVTLTPKITYDCGVVESILRNDEALQTLMRYSHGNLELFHLDDGDWTHRELRW